MTFIFHWLKPDTDRTYCGRLYYTVDYRIGRWGSLPPNSRVCDACRRQERKARP